MKIFLMALALGSVCLVCNVNSSLAAAPEHGQIPSSLLADMGLSGMQPMSDAQGMLVRAKGNISITITQISVINFETNACRGGNLIIKTPINVVNIGSSSGSSHHGK